MTRHDHEHGRHGQHELAPEIGSECGPKDDLTIAGDASAATKAPTVPPGGDPGTGGE
jgi:hypothetical protein